MSTPFKPEWLQPGAVIPVDTPTLAAFAGELLRVNQENQTLRQALETEQKTAVSSGKGMGFNYFRALDITVLQPALETKQKTAVSPDGGTGFIDDMSREAMKQPEALRLADALDAEFVQGRISNSTGRESAVELRRLALKQWVGLTDEEVNELVARFKRYSYVLLREVEAKLKEKNNA